ncbi:MAG: hypothetical protein U0457_14125 [Candidatus Sericytochromatia bacterium]
MTECKQCLIKEGTVLLWDFFAVSKEAYLDTDKKITKIVINKDGLCNYCITFNKNYDKAHIKNELSIFCFNSKKSEYHSIVALSGGKDSITALYIAVVILKLKVIAVTYDNGFIPNKVIEQSKRICDLLEVPYIVKKRTLYNEFKQEYKKDQDNIYQAITGIDFCQICSKYIYEAVFDVAREYNIEKAIFGNKIYIELEPKVSCTKKVYINKNEQIVEILKINLLFAMDINTQIQQEILNSLSWENPKLKGYTSNCLIPSFVEFARQRKINTKPDTGYIERELRSGTYSINEAKKLIQEHSYIDPSNEIDAFFEKI